MGLRGRHRRWGGRASASPASFLFPLIMRLRAACGIAYHGYIPTGREGEGREKEKAKTPKTFWSFATVAMPVVVGWQDADVLNGAPARRR